MKKQSSRPSKPLSLRITSLVFLSILLICSSHPVSAKAYHIDLLTIEIGDENQGGLADAYLEVKPGTGRIFLDSFPLSKIDTQISTRYANKIACDYLDKDCSRYDFFYTIRADTTIVGGPSASAPLTVLTIAALEKQELKDNVVMTGIINSGGSIGPVGGINQKVLAAQRNGFEKVLIPRFGIRETSLNKSQNQEQNQTQNQSRNNSNQISENQSKEQESEQHPEQHPEEEPSLKELNLSIEVIRVSNIEQAQKHFFNNPKPRPEQEIRAAGEYLEYTQIMDQVSSKLCARALELYKSYTQPSTGDNNQKFDLKDDALNQSKEYVNKINKSYEQEEYYSAASYCFTLSLLLREENLKRIKAQNPGRLEKIYAKTQKTINEFDTALEQVNLTTFSELETYIIVKERLLDAQETLNEMTTKSNQTPDINLNPQELAYALERYYSAVYWSEFFKLKGKSIDLDNEYLKEACYKKLSEAEERMNYASLYIPLSLQNAEDTTKQAYAFAIQKNYKMCLFKASFAKAESNLLLSTVSVKKDEVEELAEEKLRAAKKVIAEEQSKNVFPILGYSYYQYANTLKQNQDSVSALIFAEYALELSNLEMYFPNKSFSLPIINYSLILFILSALVLGTAIGMIIGVRSRPKTPGTRRIKASKNKTKKRTNRKKQRKKRKKSKNRKEGQKKQRLNPKKTSE